MKAIVASAWFAVLLASASVAASEDAAVAGAGGPLQPSRMREGCAGARDIAIYQARSSCLPGGIPAYSVQVMNPCSGDECAIADIHVRCSFFSSVNLVDPRKFRRLRYDDCHVNGGRPMLGGDSLSFKYAVIAATTCVHPY